MHNHRCWAEIDLDALVRNTRFARETASAELMGIVKADAYGHGIVPVGKALEPHCAFLGVANPHEALELKPHLNPATRLFLLGPVLPENRAAVVENDLVPSLSTLDEAREFDAIAAGLGKKIAAHIVLDTGMGRIGFTAETLPAFLAEHASLKNLEAEGMATHFPSADEDPAFTMEQIGAFEHVLQTCRNAGFTPRYVHIANSAGILGFHEHLKRLTSAGEPVSAEPNNRMERHVPGEQAKPPLTASSRDSGIAESRCETAEPAEGRQCNVKLLTLLARPGLMLYGISPLPDYQSNLTPVLQLKTRVTLVRDLLKGSSISYGRTFTTSRDHTRVATLGIGYGDGYPRHLSGHDTDVLIHGQRCPLLGRVTMDQIMVDTTDLPAAPQPGDEAVLIGDQENESIHASEIAEKAGTIPWEILTRITARVPRVYLP